MHCGCTILSCQTPEMSICNWTATTIKCNRINHASPTSIRCTSPASVILWIEQALWRSIHRVRKNKLIFLLTSFLMQSSEELHPPALSPWCCYYRRTITFSSLIGISCIMQTSSYWTGRNPACVRLLSVESCLTSFMKIRGTGELFTWQTIWITIRAGLCGSVSGLFAGVGDGKCQRVIKHIRWKMPSYP